MVEMNRECCRFRHPNPNKDSITTPTFAPSYPHQTQCQSTSGTLNARHELGSYPTGNCAQVLKNFLEIIQKELNFFVPKICPLTKLEYYLILGERLMSSTFRQQTVL